MFTCNSQLPNIFLESPNTIVPVESPSYVKFFPVLSSAFSKMLPVGISPSIILICPEANPGSVKSDFGLECLLLWEDCFLKLLLIIN